MHPSPQNQENRELQIRRLLDEADQREIRESQESLFQWRRPWLWPVALGHWLATEFQFGDLSYRKHQGLPLPKAPSSEDRVARMKKAIASEKSLKSHDGSSRKG